MTFFERYSDIAERNGLEPCSQRAADMFGVTKATISSWNVKKTTPKGETVAIIADKLMVSADYLLGRTEDPTDYARRPGSTTGANNPGRITVITRQGPETGLLALYKRLDGSDRIRVEGIIQGLLLQDKYNTGAALPDAAHIRTDIAPTAEMIAHDEKVMNDF